MTALRSSSGQTVMTGRQRIKAALAAGRVDRPPVWFMRQAGRHLPGYRSLREKWSFLDVCGKPEVNRIASAEPFHTYGVDAVIVFNDILIPLKDMGMGLDFLPAPKFDRLIGTTADVAALGTPKYGESTEVNGCLRALRDEVGPDVAMLGFIGAPFTVAGFAIAGVGADRPPLDELVRSRPEVFAAMQERLTPVLADYAKIQVDAGADVIQVFESLADKLTPDEFRKVGMPHLMGVVKAIRDRVPGTPIIVFGRGLWPFVAEIGSCGAALSMDHCGSLIEARKILKAHGLNNSVQGNLSPETLLLPPARAAERAAELLGTWREIVPYPEQAAKFGPTGWVFNLGHGVPADADPRTVQAVVDCLRGFSFGSSGTSREARS